jgi:hypothetical protein
MGAGGSAVAVCRNSCFVDMDTKGPYWLTLGRFENITLNETPVPPAVDVAVTDPMISSPVALSKLIAGRMA